MATILSAGDIAIVRYDSTADTFSFVLLRDIEAGTSISFTDNGWLAAGGFRAGEDTLTYTAPAAVAAGTIVTLSGLELAVLGDQIIAYQGAPATPTILHLVDFGDGNNTVAGDAVDAQTTALPPGFTLGVNAVAVAFDRSIYAGPTLGSRAELFAAVSNPGNWIDSGLSPTQPLPPLRVQDRPVIDLDFDDSTHGGRDYRTNYSQGGASVTIGDTDISIVDRDGSTIQSAQIRVLAPQADNMLFVNGTLPPGITIASPYNSATGILTLSGTASLADYQTAIGLVEFISVGELIGSQKKIEVTVFDGAEWSSEAKAFINIVASTASPVLDLDANNSFGGGADYAATFTSGGPATPVADTDVSITDADSMTIVSATIAIGINRQVEDVLSFTGPAGPITADYVPATGILTLTGSATLAEYQTALRQVAFSTTSSSTDNRVIEVTVNDGTFDSNIARTFMHVSVPPPNAAPVLNLDADFSTTGGADYLTTFTDGGLPVAIADTDVLITDDEPDLESATVTLTNPQAADVLTFNGLPPAGITVNVGAGVITLTGTASRAAYQAALQQVTFDAGANPATDTRIITVVVNDGTANSNTANAIVQVVEVNNNAPTLDLDGDDSTAPGTTYRATFTENGAAVPIADADTVIDDPDLDPDMLASARITLTNPQTGDLLAIGGALPAGIAASAYDPITGLLTLTGTASVADYEVALSQVQFSAAGANPVTDTRIVEVVVNDGVNDSGAATALISVIATNDAPVLGGLANASYQENAAPVALSPSVTLTDDDDTDLNGAVVRITGGSFPGDGDTLTVGGASGGTIGGITFSWNPVLHAMVFAGESSLADYQALLQQVAFQSTSDNPTDFNASPTRTLTWSVTDGTAVTSATTTLDIVAVNDAPQETVAPAAAYTENAAPVTISPAATASDVDDINLVAGQIRIASGWQDGDILSVNGLQNGTFAGIDFNYDPVLRALVFTRPSLVADYQAFMQAVAFHSTSENPTNFGANPTRTLGWGLHDGTDYSSPVQTTLLAITELNDAPTDIVVQGGGGLAANEFVANGAVAGAVVAQDVDTAAFTYSLVDNAGGRFAVNSATGQITVLDGILLDFEQNATHNITVRANDGTSDIDRVFAVTVNNVDPEVVVGDGAANTLVGGPLNDIFHMEQGGADDVDGAGGDDTFLFGATFTAAHRIDGGAGHDQISLVGDYSAGLIFEPQTFTNVEVIGFLPGFSYAFTAADGNVAAGQTLTVWALQLASGQSLAFDGSAESDGAFRMYGGAGDDTLTGGGGDDDFLFADTFTAADRVDGGAGYDEVSLQGDYSAGITLDPQTFTNIEAIGFLPGFSYDLTAADGNVAAGQTLRVWAAQLSAGQSLAFNGAAETDGAFRMTGGAGDDNLIGGANNDAFTGGLGDDTLVGGAGFDSAVFSGLRSAYTLTNLGNGNVRVVGPDGNDTVSGVERLIFDDLRLNWPPSSGSDFNADAFGDILWRNTTNGQVQTWELDGGGGAAVDNYGNISLDWQQFAAADTNADGLGDILWRNSATGQVMSWELDGSGGIVSEVYGAAGLVWQSVGAGDFNGDGRADILFRNTSTGQVATWELDGSGGFAFESYGTESLDWKIAGIGDFNNDGLDDILWRNSTSGGVKTWELDGSGGFTSDTYGAINLTRHVFGVGDFNADGFDDILWRDNSGQVATWELDGAGDFGVDFYGAAGSAWSIMDATDTNSDGKDDVVWRNTTTGTVAAWELNGSGGFSFQGYGRNTLDWQIFDGNFQFV